ncbi:MAG: formylglycine-generating enzyme family protein, partial [Pirellulaceae bacterium]
PPTAPSEHAEVAVASLSHEALLTHWERVKQWTETNRQQLGMRARVEQSQQAWEASKRDNSRLLAPGLPLEEGRQLLEKSSHLLNEDTRDYIRRSLSYHRTRKIRRRVLAAALLLMVAWVSFEWYGRIQANSLLTADPVNVPHAIDGLSPWQLWARHYLRRIVDSHPDNEPESTRELHARIALVQQYGERAEELQQDVLNTRWPIEYLGIMSDALRPPKKAFTDELWLTFQDSSKGVDTRFRAGLALAGYAPQPEKKWSATDYDFLASELVSEKYRIHQQQLYAYLQPIGEDLATCLKRLFSDEEVSETQRVNAAQALVAFVGDDVALMAELAAKATAEQYDILFSQLAKSADPAVEETLHNLAGSGPASDFSEPDRIALGKRRAGAAITLLRRGLIQSSFAAFEFEDDPESLTQFVHRCREQGVTADELVKCLDATEDVYSRFAALLALGDYALEEVSEDERDGLIEHLKDSYATDPSSAIHGATGWLLRQWGFDEAVATVDRTPVPYDPTGEREWYVVEIEATQSGQPYGPAWDRPYPLAYDPKPFHFTFIVFPPGEYMMGSPDGEAGRNNDENRHLIKLTRPIAVSDREVTWAQFSPFDEGGHHEAWEEQFEKELGPNDPAFGVNWFEAVEYCRWLTEQAGMGESDQCYADRETLPRDAEGNPENWPVNLERHGYRLPTESEWEYVCRSGRSTAYSFGSDRGMLRYYGWFLENSDDRWHAVGEKRPSVRGLFDIHGNVYEWCQDWYGRYDVGVLEDRGGPKSGSGRVIRGGSWNSYARYCRSAIRYSLPPGERSSYGGFRVASVLVGASSE